MLNTSVSINKTRHIVYLPYKGYTINVISNMKTSGFMQETKSYELSVILPTRGAAVERYGCGMQGGARQGKLAFVCSFVNNILMD